MGLAQENLLVNGSFETWHAVTGQGWGEEEPDGWHGWEIHPWSPPGSNNPDHITIQMDRPTGVPTPLVQDGAHRAGMDAGWRSCYGGLYQEVTGLPPGDYRFAGWVAWLYEHVDEPELHAVEILVKDGSHTPDVEPDGQVVFRQDGSVSNTSWQYCEASVACTSGTLTVYANIRADDWDGAAFAHFDGFELTADAAVAFSNFQSSRVIDGNAYDLTITYETDIAATTQVEWGATTAYGNTSPLDAGLVTQHTVQLEDVAPLETVYHYRARATAAPDIDVYSADRTFDAPLVTCNAVTSTIESQTGTICTINWSTNFATSANAVFYRASGSGSYAPVADPSDPQPRTIHTAVLAGLTLDTEYEYYVQSSASDIIPASSAVRTFRTPVQPGPPIEIGMSMIGGSIPDGGDDVGPANEVQDMIERDHPLVTISGMARTTWAKAQPEDPGDGPNVYDFSEIDAKADDLIPGKALLSYYQMWGTSPAWADWENDRDRFWTKFEEFVEAMTIYINQTIGPVYYTFENEPNISRAPDGWSWDDWYMHCLPHFHTAVHAANAQTGIDNKVIAGNLSGHAAGGFQDLYARGLKDYSDILGYHPYPYDIRDGLDVEDLAQIHSIQVDYGDGDKQILVSEGWGSGRSAGFDRSSPLIEPTAQEVENMYLAMVNGWDNVMTPRENWHPDYLWGMKFFCGNDNWGARNWRKRATPIKNGHGDITGFIVDGYHMTTDIAPYFWNGGMLDFYGNSKDCLLHVFPGNGLVLMNPGFELPSEPPNAHLPHFWQTTIDPAPAADYTLDDIVFHGGSRSLKLMQTQTGELDVTQMTAKRSAIPGVGYRTRVWIRTEEDANLTARFYLRFSDLDVTTTSSKVWAPGVVGTQDWQQVEVTATAPAFASRVEVGCSITGVGSAWFDDVTIARTTQSETGPIRGYTLDEGQLPVPNSIVRSTTGNIQAVSDENGYYEIPAAATGTYDFVCRKAGYVPHRVKNQTVAADKLLFVNFNMGIPKPGLTVTAVTCDPATLGEGGDPATVTVTVANDKPYPNQIGEVGVFVEQSGNDVTELFSIKPDELNPQVIPAANQAEFLFELLPQAGAGGHSFEVNAYAFGQEDRPNMLENGGFDGEPWGNHWSFSGGADTLTWDVDTSDYYSPPRALKCYVAENGDYTWNWANNWSAYGPDAVPALPARNYTVGVHHKDNLTGGVSVNLFIQEYYYDGSDWYHNGRRFAAVPHRSVWAHDVMIYETGDPNVTQGLYTTNRLVISCGPCTNPTPSSGENWWDDLYVKETGDWLADDRADSGAQVTVAPAPLIELSIGQIDVETWVRSDPADRHFTVRNAGVGTLDYVIESNVNWLELVPNAGSSAGETDTIAVQFDLAEVPAGVHTGIITVSADEAANSPQTVTVTLTVSTVDPDFDGDGDVDQADFGHLQICLSGQGVTQDDPACLDARLDEDEDVDEDDCLALKVCLSAPGILATPGCME